MLIKIYKNLGTYNQYFLYIFCYSFIKSIYIKDAYKTRFSNYKKTTTNYCGTKTVEL